MATSASPRKEWNTQFHAEYVYSQLSEPVEYGVVITSILEAGFSTVVFRTSADCTASGWYTDLEWLLNTSLSFTQLEKVCSQANLCPFNYLLKEEGHKAHRILRLA